MPESPYTADLPDVLTIDSGATASLPLPGPLGSGYSWDAVVEGTAVNATITFERAAPVGEPSSPVSFAHQRLELGATAPGTALVRLKLARSWQPDSPLATHSVQVTVRGPQGMTKEPLLRKETPDA
jgi:hypothetical protein